MIKSLTNSTEFEGIIRQINQYFVFLKVVSVFIYVIGPPTSLNLRYKVQILSKAVTSKANHKIRRLHFVEVSEYTTQQQLTLAISNILRAQ